MTPLFLEIIYFRLFIYYFLFYIEEEVLFFIFAYFVFVYLLVFVVSCLRGSICSVSCCPVPSPPPRVTGE